MYKLTRPSPANGVYQTFGVRLLDGAHNVDRSLLACRGTPHSDRIVGSALPDEIYAGAGNDTIDVRGGGSDTVECGPGHDTVYADPSDHIAHNRKRIIRTTSTR